MATDRPLQAGPPKWPDSYEGTTRPPARRHFAAACEYAERARARGSAEEGLEAPGTRKIGDSGWPAGALSGIWPSGGAQVATRFIEASSGRESAAAAAARARRTVRQDRPLTFQAARPRLRTGGVTCRYRYNDRTPRCSRRWRRWATTRMTSPASIAPKQSAPLAMIWGRARARPLGCLRRSGISSGGSVAARGAAPAARAQSL